MIKIIFVLKLIVTKHTQFPLAVKISIRFIILKYTLEKKLYDV